MDLLLSMGFYGYACKKLVYSWSLKHGSSMPLLTLSKENKTRALDMLRTKLLDQQFLKLHEMMRGGLSWVVTSCDCFFSKLSFRNALKTFNKNPFRCSAKWVYSVWIWNVTFSHSFWGCLTRRMKVVESKFGHPLLGRSMHVWVYFQLSKHDKHRGCS